MRQFAYARPRRESEALSLLAQRGTSVIAGGTELLNWMRLGIAAPARLVDIGRLPGREEIALDGEVLRIGALADLNRIGEHPLVRSRARALAESCLAAASAQLRNRATIGGNVLQRTRCAYFRSEEPVAWACNKRLAGSGCSALAGHGDGTAIFDWTDACAATHPSDPLVALVCLDAEAELLSADGTRRLALRDLHLTQREAEVAGEDGALAETTLRPGELIAGYRVHIQPGTGSAYIKVRDRQSYAYALVAAAAAVRVEEGLIAAVSIALGSVAQRPWRLRRAEEALVGQPVAEDVLLAAIDEDMAQARPLPGNEFKVGLARNAAVRAVLTAVGK